MIQLKMPLYIFIRNMVLGKNLVQILKKQFDSSAF